MQFRLIHQWDASTHWSLCKLCIAQGDVSQNDSLYTTYINIIICLFLWSVDYLILSSLTLFICWLGTHVHIEEEILGDWDRKDIEMVPSVNTSPKLCIFSIKSAQSPAFFQIYVRRTLEDLLLNAEVSRDGANRHDPIPLLCLFSPNAHFMTTIGVAIGVGCHSMLMIPSSLSCWIHNQKWLSLFWPSAWTLCGWMAKAEMVET